MGTTSGKARIAYSGPALDSGEMDVRELAPALMAFADLVDDAYSAIGGEKKIKVMLSEDSIKKGSFDITLFLQYTILEQAKLFMTSADENGLSALLQLLGWGTGGIVGIFSFIKMVRNRSISKATSINNNSQVRVDFSDGKYIDISGNLFKIYVNEKCRADIENVVKPLAQDGIDSFELRDPNDYEDKKPIEIVSKNERNYFDAPPAREEDFPETTEQEMLVRIKSLTFEKDQKWRFTDGENTFWAKIEDKDFLSKVEDGQPFADGDMLRIRYYTKQKIKNGNLSTEYVITKVLEIKKRMEQIPLNFDSKNE